jgi:Ca2+-binding EF-hand superfamily protein
VRVKHTETALGDKLQQLDKDRDGVLNSQELRAAILKVLKKDESSNEAQELVRLLDKDGDGKGTMRNTYLIHTEHMHI